MYMVDKSGELMDYMLKPLKIISASGRGFTYTTGLENKLTYFGEWVTYDKN